MDTMRNNPQVSQHRMTFKAYARGHRVEMVGNGRAVGAELIDIYRHGARLLTDFPAKGFVSMGDRLDVNILLDGGEIQSGPAPCLVTWSRGFEIDVEFPVPLDLGLAELQVMVDHAPAA